VGTHRQQNSGQALTTGQHPSRHRGQFFRRPSTRATASSSGWPAAFIQNIRRGHYELGVDEPVTLRVMAAFYELALAI
jgi:hypothetical protein